MSLDLIRSFPYSEPRQIQREVLDVLSREWDNYSNFVIGAPTAFGKTALAKTLMNAFRSVSCITPTNLLVEQFLAEFPDTPTLARLDSYRCETWKRPCSITRAKCRWFCKPTTDANGNKVGCPASADLATAKYRRGPGVYNYHTYLAHGIQRDVLVVDEAHNLIHTIRDRLGLTIWQHDYKFPRNMYTYEQIAAWIATLPANRQNNKKIQLLREAVTFKVPRYIVQRTTADFNGKGTIRGQPEERDCLRLLPVDISSAPPMFWPAGVSKRVLLSATIGRKDIESLGLRGKTLYLDCKSPIPAENRPIHIHDVVSVNHSNIEFASEELAKYITNVVDYHSEEKGIIHATYKMSNLLRKFLIGERFMFHTRENKREMYQRFRDSNPRDGVVLVACGMYEGIDLPEDMGRFQIISKIPWTSLADPAIRHLAELDPEWYTWEVLKVFIQACGRICRTPEDHGITYVPDSSIHRLLRDGLQKELIPEWFMEAIQYDEPV